MTRAENTFAFESAAYATARPTYPAELFEWVAENSLATSAAWDCACGTGQAAVGLAPHFTEIHATDISPEQLASATPHRRVRYAAAVAERAPFRAGAFDAVTVAQALHWFDFEPFWDEVARVGRPGAFFCAWGYDWFECPPDLEGTLVAPLRRIVAPYWRSNNRLLWDGYRARDVAFPWARIEPPPFAIVERWTAARVLDYMRTWSAYKLCRADAAGAPTLDALLDEAAPLLRSPEPMTIRMPLKILAGHVR